MPDKSMNFWNIGRLMDDQDLTEISFTSCSIKNAKRHFKLLFLTLAKWYTHRGCLVYGEPDERLANSISLYRVPNSQIYDILRNFDGRALVYSQR